MTYHFETFPVASRCIAEIVCDLINKKTYEIIDECYPNYDIRRDYYVNAKVEEFKRDVGENYFYVSGESNCEEVKEFWEYTFSPTLKIDFKNWEPIGSVLTESEAIFLKRDINRFPEPVAQIKKEVSQFYPKKETLIFRGEVKRLADGTYEVCCHHFDRWTFLIGTKYKGMVPGKWYTPAELGLVDE